MDEDMLETRELDLEWYAGSKGYDEDFLGVKVRRPELTPERVADCAPLTNGKGYELKYTHFSLIISKSRQLAIWTAVNLDGKKAVAVKRSRDVWYFDPRMDRKYQLGPEIYKHRDIDRGHLVRRLDPVWGPEAKTADEDTFHFTNCSPQHSKLNQRTWLGLETYILDNAIAHDLKVTVFTGPVFGDDDKVLRGYRVPAEFWKVVVMVKADKTLSATAYIESQRDLVSNLEGFQFGKYQTYQVPVRQVETLTGLHFGDLAQHDPLQNLEGRGQTAVAVKKLSDVQF